MFADPLLLLYDLLHLTMCDLESFQEHRELQSGHAWESQPWPRFKVETKALNCLRGAVKTGPQFGWAQAHFGPVY